VKRYEIGRARVWGKGDKGVTHLKDGSSAPLPLGLSQGAMMARLPPLRWWLPGQ